MEYEFNLKFKLPKADLTEDAVMNQLGAQGCTDALVGLGLPGYIGLEFVRESDSAENAILSAINAIPGCELVEAGPDYVGLTDVADMVGMTRQNMRKLFLGNAMEFPSPVHGGSAMVWHLYQVLDFLKTRKYEIADGKRSVADMTMKVNAVKQQHVLNFKGAEKIERSLFA